MPSHPRRPSAIGGALQVALLYALFAGLWILFSDRAVAVLFSEPAAIVRAGTLKGWLFVAVTTLLLFALVNRLLGRLRASLGEQRTLATERLRALRLLESIADSSADAIFAKDMDGRYILFNRAASRFVGRPVDQVLGQDDRALFPPEQAASLIASSQEAIVGGRPVSREEHLATTDGERVFLATKAPLRDPDGRIVGVFGIARDITERHRAESQQRDRDERLEAIVAHSPSALSLKTPDGRYALANPNVQRILGKSEAEIVGHTDDELFPADCAAAFRANDERVLRTLERHAIEEKIPVDGVLRTYMAHLFPVLGDDGKARFVCRIALDISASKQAEAERRQLTDDLSATLHAIPELLVEMDENGRCIKVIARPDKLRTASIDAVSGRDLDEFLPPEAAATMRRALAAAGRLGVDYGRCISLLLADGEHHFELSVARKTMAPGLAPHFVVLSRDITERTRSEQELRRYNEELERFNTAAVDREIEMIALKRQINELAAELGRAPPFDLTFAADPVAGETP